MTDPQPSFHFRTPAQLAARAAIQANFMRLRRGRRLPKPQPEPFGRAPSAALTAIQVKTVPPSIRALIDAALARRRENT